MDDSFTSEWYWQAGWRAHKHKSRIGIGRRSIGKLANWQKLSTGLGGGLRRQPVIGCYLLVIDEEDDDITIAMIS